MRPQVLLSVVVFGTCVILYGSRTIHWGNITKHPGIYYKQVGLRDLITINNQIVSSKEGVLPPTVLPPSSWARYSEKWRGLTLPVLTTAKLGRLGNVMGEYATLYALWRHYNVSAVVRSDMASSLGENFKRRTLPDLPGEFTRDEWRPVSNLGEIYNYAPVEVAAAGLMGPHLFLVNGYTIEIHMFNSFKDDIRREFTFTEDIMEKVRGFFTEIINKTKSTISDTVFVGFHIRRTDYVNHIKNLFGGTLPDVNYFNRALNYYRDKFNNKKSSVLFVVSSDNMTFAKSTLSKHTDVFFTRGQTPGEDLAALASCNHSIVTVGSFGFWSGYLTGGEVVYPDVHLEKTYRFSRAMFEKAGLDNFTPLPVH